MSDLPSPANETGARFLVRLDDACPTLNRKMWREAEAVLDAHDVRPIVAVIPDNRDPKMMIDEPDPDFWERVRGWQARGWGIGLHGCHHAYVTHDRGLFGWSKGSEFAGLPRWEQDRRIAHGLDVFAEQGIRPDMWIAPNHAFDRMTLNVLRQRGVVAVSDGPGVWPFRDRTGIFWVPMQLWRFQARPPGVWTVCQHPNVWNDGQARRFTTDIERYTGRFTDWGSIVSDFATRRRGAPDVRYAAVLRTKKSIARAIRRVQGATAATRPVHVDRDEERSRKMTSTGTRIVHVATVDLTLRFLLLPQLVALRDAGFDVATISAPGPWIADIEAEGIRHIPWHHATRAWDPREDFLAFRELLAIFRRERFDLVHTHNPKPGVMGRVAARLCRVPHVVNTVHGFYATSEDRLTKRATVLGAEWVAARCSDLEMYQSAEDLHVARRLHMARGKKAMLLGNGTDVDHFEPAAVPRERLTLLRRELGIDRGDLVVGTVGRLVAEKGYPEFFDAARRIRRDDPQVRFLAVGDSDPSKADSLRSGDLKDMGADVIFTGWRDDVRYLLALMDVFVLASWREGMPRSAIEAAAMGKPLVLTDIRGCREVVRPGVEGLLVPPGSPAALADAISQLLRDPALRRRLGEAARRRAVERFDERRVTADVVDAYRSLGAGANIRGSRIAS